MKDYRIAFKNGHPLEEKLRKRRKQLTLKKWMGWTGGYYRPKSFTDIDRS